MVPHWIITAIAAQGRAHALTCGGPSYCCSSERDTTAHCDGAAHFLRGAHSRDHGSLHVAEFVFRLRPGEDEPAAKGGLPQERAAEGEVAVCRRLRCAWLHVRPFFTRPGLRRDGLSFGGLEAEEILQLGARAREHRLCARAAPREGARILAEAEACERAADTRAHLLVRVVPNLRKRPALREGRAALARLAPEGVVVAHDHLGRVRHPDGCPALRIGHTLVQGRIKRDALGNEARGGGYDHRAGD
mmetsp:Transcript_3992/g.11283  ORF Transcript_3992/g.11283 Transcript_3992/m.11283 type:complete len:246 (-) Transcript_3992:586-1323(-)